MTRVKKAIYWTDSYGQEHNIREISNDYLMNIIAWLQRRKDAITFASEDSAIDIELDSQFKMLRILVKELARRQRKNIVIEENYDSNY